MNFKNLHVLQINTEKTWRGGERQTIYILQGLREEGLSVSLLCLKNSPLHLKAQKQGFKTFAVKNNLEAILFLANYGKNFDILHAQAAKAQTQAVLTKPFHKRPIVYTRRVDFRPRGILTKFKYTSTDKIVVISYAIKNILEEFGIRNTIVIPSFFVPKKFDNKKSFQLKESLKLGNKKVVATIAALVPHKDPFTMVRAIKELTKIRKDFVFLHFGQGELYKEVACLISELSLEDYYFLMGFHDQVEDYFSIFDVFVISSEQEGLCSSILDAFFYKVPVVSTDAGGLKELVKDRGILCPKKDFKCLAKAINLIIENKNLKSKLIQKAYIEVVQKYNLQTNIKKYLQVYKQVIK